MCVVCVLQGHHHHRYMLRIYKYICLREKVSLIERKKKKEPTKNPNHEGQPIDVSARRRLSYIICVLCYIYMLYK